MDDLGIYIAVRKERAPEFPAGKTVAGSRGETPKRRPARKLPPVARPSFDNRASWRQNYQRNPMPTLRQSNPHLASRSPQALRSLITERAVSSSRFEGARFAKKTVTAQTLKASRKRAAKSA